MAGAGGLEAHGAEAEVAGLGSEGGEGVGAADGDELVAGVVVGEFDAVAFEEAGDVFLDGGAGEGEHAGLVPFGDAGVLDGLAAFGGEADGAGAVERAGEEQGGDLAEGVPGDRDDVAVAGGVVRAARAR